MHYRRVGVESDHYEPTNRTASSRVYERLLEHLQVTAGARVALRNDSYTLHLLLPTKVDPLVSLMKVEKVPDSTYDMIGGLDQQIKEIKEVCQHAFIQLPSFRLDLTPCRLDHMRVVCGGQHCLVIASSQLIVKSVRLLFRSLSCLSSILSCLRVWVWLSQRYGPFLP